MNPRHAKFAIAGLLVAVTAVPFVLQWHSAAQLHALQEIGRQQSAKLLVRRAEDATATAAAGVRDSAARRTQDEIVRLQREIAQLRELKADAETRKRFRDLAEPAIAAAYGLKPTEPKPLPDGSIPLRELADRGRASPETLLQTTHWALLHADLDRLAQLASFDPDSRAALDAWFAALTPAEQTAFGTADRLFAAMQFNAAFPPLVESGLELGKLTQSTPNDALLHFRVRGPDGRILQVDDLPVRHDTDGWSQPVSVQAVNAFRTTFSYLPPAQRRLLSQPAPSR